MEADENAGIKIAIYFGSFSGSILLIGGRNQGFVNNNFRYFPNKDRWCSIAPLQKPHYEHFSTLLFDSSVLIFGGIDARGYARDTELLR